MNAAPESQIQKGTSAGKELNLFKYQEKMRRFITTLRKRVLSRRTKVLIRGQR